MMLDRLGNRENFCFVLKTLLETSKAFKPSEKLSSKINKKILVDQVFTTGRFSAFKRKPLTYVGQLKALLDMSSLETQEKT